MDLTGRWRIKVTDLNHSYKVQKFLFKKELRWGCSGTNLMPYTNTYFYNSYFTNRFFKGSLSQCIDNRDIKILTQIWI